MNGAKIFYHYTPDPDPTLIEIMHRIEEEDKSALTELYYSFYPHSEKARYTWVYYVTRTMLNDEGGFGSEYNINVVLNSTLSVINDKIGSVKDDSKYCSYIYGILKRKVKEVCRETESYKKKDDITDVNEEDFEFLLSIASDSHASPEKEFSYNETIHMVKKDLGHDYEKLFELKFEKELSVAEICDILNIKSDCCYKRLQNLKRELKWLKEKYVQEEIY